MSIGERIRKLRKSLPLNQQEFASRIHVSRSNIGNIEMGKVSATDRVIGDICREFHVTERWLRYGEEPMYDEAALDPCVEEIMDIYLTLDEDARKYLIGYAQRLLEEQFDKL